MFRNAHSIASKFTLPFVISRREVGGQCASGLGALTMINDEGWFLTAFHMLEAWGALTQECANTKAHEDRINAINNDPALNRQQKRQQLGQLGSVKTTANKACSAWFGVGHPVRIVHSVGLPGVDLGVGRLQPWQPNWCGGYATIKDPARDFTPGASLCRLGFPFHEITPTYDPQAGFRLPAGTTPIPIFPNEGILTRFGNIQVIDGNTNQVIQPPFPWQYIETSSPGLRGQSGGPIVDTQGSVWGVQVNTVSYALNLEAPGKPPKFKEHLEHQFLNVGQGVHATTILGLLNEQGVRFQLSAY